MSSLPDFSPRADFRWQRTTFLRLAAFCLPLIDQGVDAVDALHQAQQYLPADRQHTRFSLVGIVKRSQWPEALRLARSLSEPERAHQVNALMAGLTGNERLSDDELDAEANGNRAATDDNVIELPSRMVWNDQEWKLIYRRYTHLKRDLGDTRSVADLVDEAQKIELPPNRWRARGGLRSASYLPRTKAGNLWAQLDRAATLPDDLLADHPFDPAASPAKPTQHAAPTPPPAARPRRVPRAPGPSALAVALQTAMEPAPTPVEAPPPAPVPPPPAEPRRTLQERPQPIQAPTPLPIAPERPREPLRAFGDSFGMAMSSLMDATAQHLVATMEVRITKICEGLLDSAIQHIVEAIPAMVSQVLAEQLGGEVGAVPAVPAAEEHHDEHHEEHETNGAPEDVIKLDIVGLLQAQAADVKRALGVYGSGIRYIDANHAQRWTPRGLVVVNAKFVDAPVWTKVRLAGSKVIKVHGGITACINAIKTLYEDEGISLP